MNQSLLLILIAGAATTAHALNAFAGPAGKLTSTGAKAGRVDAGPIEMSEMGFGTWSWVSGNEASFAFCAG
jgi:hypothetical protein